MILLNALCAVLSATLLAWWTTLPALTPYRRFMVAWLAFNVVSSTVVAAVALAL